MLTPVNIAILEYTQLSALKGITPLLLLSSIRTFLLATLSFEFATVLILLQRITKSVSLLVESLSQDLLISPSFDLFYDELRTTVLSSVVLSFCGQRNYTMRSRLAVKSFVNCPYDTDSHASIGCSISTAKTNLFLLMSSIPAG